MEGNEIVQPEDLPNILDLLQKKFDFVQIQDMSEDDFNTLKARVAMIPEVKKYIVQTLKVLSTVKLPIYVKYD